MNRVPAHKAFLFHFWIAPVRERLEANWMLYKEKKSN